MQKVVGQITLLNDKNERLAKAANVCTMAAMLTTEKANKTIWAVLPAGPKKTIYKDQTGLSATVVLCKGVYRYATLVEIDGESMVSFRRVGKRENTFCICTTSVVTILEEQK